MIARFIVPSNPCPKTTTYTKKIAKKVRRLYTPGSSASSDVSMKAIDYPNAITLNIVFDKSALRTPST